MAHGVSGFHSNDSTSYIQLETALADTGEFVRNGVAEIVRTAGYPDFLIPGVVLENVDGVTLFLQIVLSFLTVYFVYRIAFDLFGKIYIAERVALFFAVEPLSILYASKILTETLYTFVLKISVHSF